MWSQLSGQPIAKRLLVIIPAFSIGIEAGVRIWHVGGSITTGLGQGHLIRIAWVACMISTVALALLLSRWALIPLAGWIAIELGSTVFGLYSLGIGWLDWVRPPYLMILGCLLWVVWTKKQ